MSTAEHLPSGWPFESSHYMSTFRTPQLGYCRHNVQPSSVHRKNNPHAALTDPWRYPDKVTYLHVTEVLVKYLEDQVPKGWGEGEVRSRFTQNKRVSNGKFEVLPHDETGTFSASPRFSKPCKRNQDSEKAYKKNLRRQEPWNLITLIKW